MMRSIYRTIALVVLSVGLLCSQGRSECYAQGLPTIDIQRVLQSVYGIIQDAETNGFFSEFSDLQMKTEEFQEWKAQFELFRSVYQSLSSGTAFGVEIIETVEYFKRECSFFLDSWRWFTEVGAAPSITFAVQSCLDDFQYFFDALVEDCTAKTSFIENLRSGNAIDLVEATYEFLTNYKKLFYQTAQFYHGQINRLYYEHMQMQNAYANSHFVNSYYFY